MRGRIPQQPPPPCTPLVAVIIVAAATATVLADTVAAFLGLVRAIHECGGDVETMLRRSMRRRESLKPSRREKSSFQATSSSLRSLVVPRRPSAPFPEEASAAIPSAMKLVPSKGGMLVPSEIDFTHSRTQTTLTQFALVVPASAPPSNSGQGGPGISLLLTGKGSAVLPHRVRASVPCPFLPWALARSLSLSPSGTGGNIEAAPSLRSQSTGVGAANNGFGRTA